jgi:hypothetical protein
MSSFACQSLFYYIPDIINLVYRMVSNLLISWAHLDCQVSSMRLISDNELFNFKYVFNRSDCLLCTTFYQLQFSGLLQN